MLELSGVSHSYQGAGVLHDVSCRFAAGQVTGIIGPNGAGKTTLLKLAAGLMTPARGAVSSDAFEFADRRARAQELAYLPQFHSSAWPLACQDLVALGLLPYGDALPDAAQRVAAALQQCGASAFAERGIDSLSGGERARVHVARLLVGKARLLLLDEPVQSLDAAGALAVMDVLRAAATHGKAVVTVLHDLTLAAQFCDHIIVLHEGRVAAEGSPQEVLSATRLAPIFGVSFDAVEAAGHRILVANAAPKGDTN